MSRGRNLDTFLIKFIKTFGEVVNLHSERMKGKINTRFINTSRRSVHTYFVII